MYFLLEDFFHFNTVWHQNKWGKMPPKYCGSVHWQKESGNRLTFHCGPEGQHTTTFQKTECFWGVTVFSESLYLYPQGHRNILIWRTAGGKSQMLLVTLTMAQLCSSVAISRGSEPTWIIPVHWNLILKIKITHYINSGTVLTCDFI